MAKLTSESDEYGGMNSLVQYHLDTKYPVLFPVTTLLGVFFGELSFEISEGRRISRSDSGPLTRSIRLSIRASALIASFPWEAVNTFGSC
ncbi:hypothetical protein GJAV_G00219020 [Gymnothorax javanicus]|nr:hypothetical protein GJAV_G00219020 [Gymnothorax javanicus]